MCDIIALELRLFCDFINKFLVSFSVWWFIAIALQINHVHMLQYIQAVLYLYLCKPSPAAWDHINFQILPNSFSRVCIEAACTNTGSHFLFNKFSIIIQYICHNGNVYVEYHVIIYMYIIQFKKWFIFWQYCMLQRFELHYICSLEFGRGWKKGCCRNYWQSASECQLKLSKCIPFKSY